MNKLVIVAVAFVAYGVMATPEPEAKAEAKPGILAAAPLVAAPAIAPAVVTATSSQAFVRNYNALAAPLVAAPVPVAASYVAAPAAPFVASPYVSPYYASNYLAAPYFI
ncbi:NADH-quinone oxidoreductase subunit I 2-like [Harmonia axyridis]|uniref:NADH-quinone oxidoreductase subunit I 2-like n=1 Tax=Harmonia axyridis TaxID=115357 RepID=UPI001E275089|nr:NADH-quinone oxidoreductase subunit I 2-like [Harmonia axyridis]